MREETGKRNGQGKWQVDLKEELGREDLTGEAGREELTEEASKGNGQGK